MSNDDNLSFRVYLEDKPKWERLLGRGRHKDVSREILEIMDSDMVKVIMTLKDSETKELCKYFENICRIINEKNQENFKRLDVAAKEAEIKVKYYEEKIDNLAKLNNQLAENDSENNCKLKLAEEEMRNKTLIINELDGQIRELTVRYEISQKSVRLLTNQLEDYEMVKRQLGEIKSRISSYEGKIRRYLELDQDKKSRIKNLESRIDDLVKINLSAEQNLIDKIEKIKAEYDLQKQKELLQIERKYFDEYESRLSEWNAERRVLEEQIAKLLVKSRPRNTKPPTTPGGYSEPQIEGQIQLGQYTK